MSQEPPQKRKRHDEGDDEYQPKRKRHDEEDDEYQPYPKDEGAIDVDAWESASDHSEPEDPGGTVYYDAGKDGPPNHPTYHRLFDHAQDAARTIREKAQQLLCGECNKHLARLRDRLDAIMELPRPKVVRIALVGQPGSGKSSLINSLLDLDGLAVTGCSGSSCTNVAVEFMSPLQGQTTPLAAEVMFHDEGLRDFIVQLVEDYRRPINDAESTDSDDDEDDNNKADSLGKNSAQAENAFDMLSGLLREHGSLPAPDCLRSLLEFSETAAGARVQLRRVVNTLEEYLQSLIRRVCGSDTSKLLFIVADSAHSLNELLQPYTRMFASTNTAQMWPIVKRVRVGLQELQLMHHVIIADLPGLDDDNRLRCQATHEYLHTCDSAWIVANINRVCDSTHVLDTIQNLDKRMDGRVALVCTHTDLGVTQELFNDLKTRFPCAEVNAHEAARKDVQDRREAMLRADALASKQIDKESKKILRSIVKAQKDALRVANYANDLSLIPLRIKYVQAQLKRKFPCLRVFGVSNNLYRELRFQHPKAHFRQLKASDTGITELRHYSLKIPGDRTWDAFQRFYQGPLKDFRDLLGIVVQSKGVHGRHEWQDKLKIPLSSIERHIAEYYDGGDALFSEQITLRIEADIDKHWRKAIEASKKWEGKPFTHSIYNKFARNKGSFECPKVEQQNWNEQLAGSVKTDLRRRWTDLQNKQIDRKSALLSTLSARLQNSIATDKIADADQKDLFVRQSEEMTLRHCDALKAAIADDFTKLRGLVGTVQWRMEGTGPDSYIAQELVWTYASIAQESGKGMTKRMHAKMQGRLEDRNRDIIGTLAKLAKKEFCKERESHRTAFQADIDGIISKVEDNYKAMAEDIPLDDQAMEMRKALTELHEKIVKPKMDKIERSLKELQRQYFVDAA